MATDNGTLEIKEPEKSPVLRTKELFIEGNNTDPVTGFPFEALGMREKLIEIFRDAIKNHKVLAFIDGEIEDTVNKGNPLSVDDYIKEIQKRWGNRRTSPEALGIFLYHAAAKATSRALFTKV